jgi:type IV pilus assembly protein PilM
MARAERILAIDIGATSIKVGEFEYPGREAVTLINFAHREYEEELTDTSRSVVVAGLLRQMLVENNFTARRTLMSISGQSAFTRFVRLPPFSDDQSRIRQIVEFEARQNVPFPMEEVIWDYQLVAGDDAEDIDVMFVVIKNDIVEQMTGAVQAVGLEPILVDVAPAACYNAGRANRVGQDECAMILNIGGRSTNLLFADGGRIFARTIPIAGHSITQHIGKEFGIGFAEAEELKRRHGFVALGGAYAEPESETAAAVSKIIRNVMARLHGEINRSISVYRAQQKGNRPVKLYLTGGSSTMTYTDHFFAEKLRMEVEYLNPFGVVQLGPSVDRARLEEVAHMFSEVIGLGLRFRMSCPIEVSLVPESITRQQALRRKKPYLVLSMIFFSLIFAVAWWGLSFRAGLYENARRALDKQRTAPEILQKSISEAKAEMDQKDGQYKSLVELLQQRARFPRVINELAKLKPENLWLVSIKPLTGELKAISTDETATEGGGGMFGAGAGAEGGPGGMFGSSSGGADMGMGGGMEGGGGMFGAGGGGATGPTLNDVEITGFEIIGHSVNFRDVSRGRPARPAPTPTPATPAVPEPAGLDDGMGEEEKPAVVDMLGTPESQYLTALRKSELFDDDKSFTEFRKYYPPRQVKNLASFVIQVKLKEPIPFQQVVGSASRGTGSGMGGPEGMGM